MAKEVNLYPTLSTCRWRRLCSAFASVRRCDSVDMSDQTQDTNLVGLPRSAPSDRHAGIGTTPSAWYCENLTHQNPPLPTPVVPSTRVTLLLQSLGHGVLPFSSPPPPRFLPSIFPRSNCSTLKTRTALTGSKCCQERKSQSVI